MRIAEAWLLSYLLNALWQVPLIFVAAWLVARAIGRSDTANTHTIWVAALLLEVSLPACSVNPLPALQAGAHFFAQLFETKAATYATVTVTMGTAQTTNYLHTSPLLLTITGTLYVLVGAYFLVRLAVGFYRTLQLNETAQPLALSDDLSHLFARLQRVFGVHSVTVASSDAVCVPVVLGVRKPLLLLPCIMLSGAADMRNEDIGAALAHELAHVRRHDFAKNLFYQILSLPIAFHPMLWLTRGRIAESRELLCDALAADALNDRQRYARSLLRLASGLSGRTRSNTLHAIGMFDANSFENFERRVMNLIHIPTPIHTARRVAVYTLAFVLGFGACTSALALHMQVAPLAQQANTQPAAPMVLAIPRSGNGAPAQVIVADMTPASGAAPAHVRLLTPATIPVDATAASEPSTSTMQDVRLPVAGNIIAGNIESKVTPVYPQEAKDKHISGAVVLAAIIDKEGNISNLKFVSGPNELARSAQDAVKQWKYKPYLLNGQPTEVETTITINYSLAN